MEAQPIVFFHLRTVSVGYWADNLNAQHLHLFNGANVFSRKRLAAEHGIKFGFVVKPKPIEISDPRITPAQKNRITMLLEKREAQIINHPPCVTFSGEETIKEAVKRAKRVSECNSALNQFFTPGVFPHLKFYPEWM